MTDLSVSDSPETNNLKQCTKCGEWKPATTEYFLFRKDYNKLRNDCRECNRANCKARYQAKFTEDRVARIKWQLDNPDLKRCAKCGVAKPATTEHFRTRKSSKDGLRGECIVCTNIIQKRWRDANPNKCREWREANVERVRECTREYRRKRRKDNPERYREIYSACAHNRRARKLQNGGTHTAADIRAQYDNQRGKCWWCGKKVGKTYHVDHRIPLARGGSNAPENIVIACPSCNHSKGSKMPWEWSGQLL
jgi:5-methylcytosine-specific restriction endonuclease McrA